MSKLFLRSASVHLVEHILCSCGASVAVTGGSTSRLRQFSPPSERTSATPLCARAIVRCAPHRVVVHA